MRIRTILAFSSGLALGAGAAYLGDPAHGSQRRVEARRWAMAQGRAQASQAAGAALSATRSTVLAAIEGFREVAEEQQLAS